MSIKRMNFKITTNSKSITVEKISVGFEESTNESFNY
jgi:hypothetical protein